MGITCTTAAWLAYSKRKYKLKYDKVLMLGRQYWVGFPSQDKFEEKLGQYYSIEDVHQQGDFTENLWQTLCESSDADVKSMDYSSYEGADILQDLNQPIGDDLRNRFDFVFDGGTMEHIFNYPVGLHNAMEMVRTGGVLCLVTPANNYCNHGLYQFSPALFRSIFNPDNGFELLNMTYSLEKEKYGYEGKVRLLDLPLMQQRTIDEEDLNFKEYSELYLLAKKVGEVPSHLKAMQFDWVDTWQERQEEHTATFHLPRIYYQFKKTAVGSVVTKKAVKLYLKSGKRHKKASLMNTEFSLSEEWQKNGYRRFQKVQR